MLHLRNYKTHRHLLKIALMVLVFLWSLIILNTFYLEQAIGTQPKFQDDSDSLVINKVSHQLSLQEEQAEFGGFLHFSDKPYFSQFGLQGNLIYAVSILLPTIPPPTILSFARIIISIIYLIVLWLAIDKILGNLSFLLKLLALTLLMSFQWVVIYGASLYWIPFTFFIPFTYTWIAYPRIQSTKQHIAFLIMTGFWIMFKSLSGYEFLTNIILAASVPILYFGLLDNLPLRKIVTQIFLLGIAGMAGFFVALSIHIAQLANHFNSLEIGISVLLERANVRTFGDQYIQCQGTTFQNISKYLLSSSLMPLYNFIYVDFLVIIYALMLLFYLCRTKKPHLLASMLISLIIIVVLGGVVLYYLLLLQIEDQAIFSLVLRVMSYFALILIFALSILLPKTNKKWFDSFYSGIKKLASFNLRYHVITILSFILFIITVALATIGGFHTPFILIVTYASVILLIVFLLSLYNDSQTNQKISIKSKRALYIATGWSLLCSLSWLVLAPNHAACHFHLAPIVWFIPFGVMLACMLVITIAEFLEAS